MVLRVTRMWCTDLQLTADKKSLVHMAKKLDQEHTWSMMSREKSVPDSVMMPSLIRRPPAVVTCRSPLLSWFENDRGRQSAVNAATKGKRLHKRTFVEVLAGADLLL